MKMKRKPWNISSARWKQSGGWTVPLRLPHMRFDFIEKVCDETVMSSPKESKEHIRSQKIDRILTGKYTALPCFCRHYGTGVLPDLQRNRIRPVRSARCRDYGAWKLGGCAHDSVERKRCDSFPCDGRYF